MLLLAAALFVAASAPPQPTGDMPVINPKASQPATCPATSRYEASKTRQGAAARRS